MCWQASIALSGNPSAPGKARDFVRARFDGDLGWSARSPICQDAVLVVSEFVTNAVRAGARCVTVSVSVHHDELILDAVDDAGGWPMLGRASTGDAHGRGLTLVRALTRDWGAQASEAAEKRVWASFVVPKALGDALTCDRVR